MYIKNIRVKMCVRVFRWRCECKCQCRCRCICVCMNKCECVCVYIYTYFHECVCICVCMYVRTYVCVYVYGYVHICVYVYMYICMYLCRRMCFYICMYLHLSIRIACAACVMNTDARPRAASSPRAEGLVAAPEAKAGLAQVNSRVCGSSNLQGFLILYLYAQRCTRVHICLQCASRDVNDCVNLQKHEGVCIPIRAHLGLLPLRPSFAHLGP